MASMASSTARVNGPEDDLDEWAAVDWRTHEDNVDYGNESSRRRRLGTSGGSASCRS